MSFIWKVKKWYYIAKHIRQNGKNLNKIIRKATDEEIKIYHKRKQQDITTISCDNPYCDKQFSISRNQKIFLKTINPKNHHKLEFNYCSKKCQDDHGKALVTPS